MVSQTLWKSPHFPKKPAQREGLRRKAQCFLMARRACCRSWGFRRRGRRTAQKVHTIVPVVLYLPGVRGLHPLSSQRVRNCLIPKELLSSLAQKSAIDLKKSAKYLITSAAFTERTYFTLGCSYSHSIDDA